MGALRRYRLADTTDVLVHVADLGMACCAVEFAAAVSRGLLIESTDPVTADSAATAGGADVGADQQISAHRPTHVLIVSGTVTQALAGAVEQAWLSLPEPKAALAFGACTISGGPYWDSYSVVPGIDAVIPVRRYVPGCPPRPEALIAAIAALVDENEPAEVG